MGIEVVPNDMDRLVRVGVGHLRHKCQEISLRARVPADREGLTRMYVQSGDEGLGSMADVLEFLSADTTWARWTIQMLSLYSLDTRLLVDDVRFPTTHRVGGLKARRSLSGPCDTNRR